MGLLRLTHPTQAQMQQCKMGEEVGWVKRSAPINNWLQNQGQ